MSERISDERIQKIGGCFGREWSEEEKANLQSPETRKKFSDRYSIDTVNGCWIWSGTLLSGYGSFYSKHKSYRAHRVSYFLEYGELPPILDHICDNPRCVNPKHLRKCSPRENTLRGKGPTSLNASKTHCKRGHPLTGDNLKLDKGGNRLCQKCNAGRTTRWWQKNRSKHIGSNKDVPHDWMATLTPDQVLSIRREYKKNEFGLARLGKKYGVKDSTINAILKGRTWHWLKDKDSVQSILKGE